MISELNVEGMSCNMCVGHVTKALESVEGVKSAKVSLEEKKATIEYDDTVATISSLIAAVDDEGYTATAS